MRLIAILNTVQHLGDHGREIQVPINVDEDEAVADLISRCRGASTHDHFAEGADSITLRMVQG